jgi:uncharacterized lipoprotein YmbA
MRTRLLSVLALGLAASVGGCVSLKRTPEARFFVLRSLVEPAPPSTAPGNPGLVGVLPVLLPGHLDRPQLVTWSGPGELRIDEFLRWAEPLDVGIHRVVGENLDGLLPAYRVVRAPWPAATPLLCRVRLELARVGPQETGEVLLEGRWALLPARSERPYVVRAVSLRRTPGAGATAAADPAAGVEAIDRLLADLSREIAAAVQALPPEEEATSSSGSADRR